MNTLPVDLVDKIYNFSNQLIKASHQSKLNDVLIDLTDTVNSEQPLSDDRYEKVLFNNQTYLEQNNDYDIQYASWSIPIELYKPHIYKGAKKMVYEYDNETEYDIKITTNIDGDMWIDLLKSSDDLIRQSEDYSHYFVENFRWVDNQTIELITGS